MGPEFNPAEDGSPDQPLAAPPRKGRRPSQLDYDISFFEAILERSPDYVDVLRCQGSLLTRKGLHERALVIDQRLASLLPRDPTVLYNLACSHALLGQRFQALAALGLALSAGYDDLDHLDQDTDLDSLRGDPAFRQLLALFALPSVAKSPKRPKA